MDPVTLTYYALVCGVLSLGAPQVRSALPRFAIGIAVGLGAAALLPQLRAMLGL